MKNYIKTKTFNYRQTISFLEKFAKNKSIDWIFDPEKRLMSANSSDTESLFELKIPLFFPALSANDSIENYLKKIPEDPSDYLIILIQAGSAALGYFEAGEVINHKVIKKYMIRAKQGKAQIGHLKSKGKSKAGSRLRLAQTIDFFEEINTKIAEWEVCDTVTHIFYSSSIQLWNMLFDSKIASAFEKNDSRIFKIPKDIKTPDYEELLAANQFLLSGFISFYQDIDFEEI